MDKFHKSIGIDVVSNGARAREGYTIYRAEGVVNSVTAKDGFSREANLPEKMRSCAQF